MDDRFIREPAGIPPRGYDGPLTQGMKRLSILLWTPFIAITAFAIFRGLITLAEAELAKPTALGSVIVALAAFLIALVAYFFREIVQTRLYPVIEIGVGMAAAAQAPWAANGVVSVITMLGGVRIIVDGIVRYKKAVNKKNTSVDFRAQGA